jgi:serine/threonine protein kinase
MNGLLPRFHNDYGIRFPEPEGGFREEGVFFGRFRGLVFPGRDSSIIGRGGSGVIHVTRDEIMNEVVALKLPSEAILAEPGAREEVLNEARQAKRLTHPNIVRIHDFHEKDGRWGISMQYVHGGNLEEWRGRLARHQAGTLRMYDIAQIKPWVRQLCDALAYAHVQVGIAHCDIKPRNLLLERALDPRGGEVQENILLTDFGISQKLQNCGLHTLRGNFAQTSAAKADTGGGGAVGTLPYMSPQQVAGSPTTMADDIYAIGVTIYELVTGRPPFFQGKASVIQHQIENVVPPPMEQRRRELGLTGAPEIPRQWEEAVARCLAKDPALRPANARELARLLDLDDLRVCEIVEPGIVISPYDEEQRHQRVPPREWIKEGLVKCQFTQRSFKLPQELAMLRGRALAPGRVASPFDPLELPMNVDLSEWRPSQKVVCQKTGRPFLLPDTLPPPMGVLIPDAPGTIASPYSPEAIVRLAPQDWVPAHSVSCPHTGQPFLLPGNLPALFALASLEKPGVVTSPYAPECSWTLEPPDWNFRGKTACPSTGKPLQLPREVLEWEPLAAFVDAERLVAGNPFAPGVLVPVAPDRWIPAGKIECPETGRTFRLPADLPSLVAEIVPGRLGFVRCPYTGKDYQVPLPQWVPGAIFKPADAAQAMQLPQVLPLPSGGIVHGQPARVESPYARGNPDAVVQVEPADWEAGKTILCPVTKLAFLLPSELPPLEAVVKPGQPGKAWSPYDPGCSVDISLDDWLPAKQFPCPSTGRPFILPADLEEWICDGSWVPGAPGRIRSSFKDSSEIEISEDQWKPGAVLLCLRSSRQFRVPEETRLPPLALEKAAFVHAKNFPRDDEHQAAQKLASDHPSATPEAVLSIWRRHHLGTAAEREQHLKRAAAIPGKPGWVSSPYEPGQEIQITPAVLWTEEDASFVCPASGRSFALPPLQDREPLAAEPVASQPGCIISPYAPEKGPFQLQPPQWQAGANLACPHTSHPLRLPADLPDWTPEAKLAPDTFGAVLNPWSSSEGKSVPISATDWKPGQIISMENGRRFRLPDTLPDWQMQEAALTFGRLRSPFAPDHWISLMPEDWQPSKRLKCEASGRHFRLPAKLTDAAFKGFEPHEDCTIRSPYGKKPRFKVKPEEWQPGQTVSCPETGKPVVLGKDLPMPVGVVAKERTFQVQSPFGASAWVPVEPAQWAPGLTLVCPETKRPFLLPKELPVPEALPGPKPGIVISPYDGSREIQIPPDQWLEGSEHSDKGRPFRLMDRLPPLEGTIVDGKPFSVRSPFGERPEISVPPAAWKAGGTVKCPATGRDFVLSSSIAGQLPEARLESKLRWVVSAYDQETKFEVPPQKWEARGKVACPKTGLEMLLSANLPPLEGLFVNDQPGLLHSPYTLEAGVKITLTREQWAQGGTVPCPQTGRPVAIPEGRPEWPQEKKRLPAAWLIGAAAALALGAGAYLFKDQLAPDPLKKAEETYIATNGSNAEDYLRLLEEAREKAAEDAIRLKHLREQWRVQTESRASDLTPSLLDEYVKDFEQLSDPEGLRGVEEFALQGSSPDNRTWAERRELDAALAQAPGGSPEAQAAKVLALAFAEGRPRNAEAAQWLLDKAAALPPQTLLGSILPAFEKSSPEQAAALLAKLEASTDGEVLLALAQRQEEEKAAPLKVRAAYLAAALKGKSAKAREWIASNVIAEPIPARPGLVKNPYSAEPAEITVPAKDWEPNKVVEVENILFKLPESGLAELTAAGPYVLPEGADKPGKVSNPHVPGMALEVPASQWYRGAQIAWKHPQSGEDRKLRLPADLPLLRAVPDMEKVRAQRKAVVQSPVSGKDIEVGWERWVPGQPLTETLEGAEVTTALLGQESASPDDLDPKFKLGEKDVKITNSAKASETPKLACEAKSPYTGKTILLRVSQWLPGGIVREAMLPLSDDLPAPQLSYVLPEPLEPVQGIVELAMDGQIPQAGSFVYYDATNPALPVSVDISKLKPDDFTKIRDFKLPEGGQQFRIVGPLKFELNDSDQNLYDPRTGARLTTQQASEIFASSRGSQPSGVHNGIQNQCGPHCKNGRGQKEGR